MRAAAERCIGIDVGGTRIRAARISPDGVIDGRICESVTADRDGFAAQVLRLIATLRNDGVQAVGIGIPGRVAGRSGKILSAGFLDIADLDIAGRIRAQTGLLCRVENDAAMALIAEARAMPGLVAMVTVGTGIGGALAVDGAPWHGGDVAGQFGHIVVSDTGPLCNCGRRGCVETFSSGTALGRLISDAGLPPSTTAEALLDRSDPDARALLHEWAAPIQRALETLVSVVDPDRLIMGGGLGAQMVRALDRFEHRSPWFVRPLTPARHGDDAGVIGAGLAGFVAARAQ